jgi:hypothetical protein
MIHFILKEVLIPLAIGVALALAFVYMLPALPA